MAYQSEKSFLKNVTVPRYDTNVPLHGLPPQYQAVVSPMNGTGFSDGNVAFLDSNHAMSNGEPMAAVRMQEQQLSSPHRSMSNSIPLPRKKIVSKNGITIPIATTPPIDYIRLLLSLAEDYFAAAHGEGSLAALARVEGELQAYYGLIATGLGCLEAVLKVELPTVRHVNNVDLNMCRILDCSHGWRR